MPGYSDLGKPDMRILIGGEYVTVNAVDGVTFTPPSAEILLDLDLDALDVRYGGSDPRLNVVLRQQFK